MTTTYGVISDIHHDPRVAQLAVDVLKKQGAQKLILNGDIGEIKETLEASQNHIATVLHHALQSNLETYVQPGSHETIGAYEPVIRHFQEKHSNLIDALQHPVVDSDSHRLVFIPGTDWGPGGEYWFTQSVDTGKYFLTKDHKLLDPPQNDHEAAQMQDLINKGAVIGMHHYQNLNDIKSQVADPQKTIVISHVPRRFDNLETGVDMAYFGEHKSGSVIAGIVLEQAIKEKYKTINEADTRIMAAKEGYTFKKENKGNQDLAALFDETGVNKAISAHFHESGGRAHDLACKPVKADQYVKELFWNSGQTDFGYCGLVTVDEDKIKYNNINLHDYVK